MRKPCPLFMMMSGWPDSFPSSTLLPGRERMIGRNGDKEGLPEQGFRTDARAQARLVHDRQVHFDLPQRPAQDGEDSSRSLTWMSGCASRNVLRIIGSRYAPVVGRQPRVTSPLFRPDNSSSSLLPLSSCANASSALGRNTRPRGVSAGAAA